MSQASDLHQKLARCEAENEQLRFRNNVTAYTKLADRFVLMGGLGFIAWCAKESAFALAGKFTNVMADINLEARGSWNEAVQESAAGLCGYVDQIVWASVASFAFGFYGWVYGRRQAQLRQRAIAHLAEYKQKYEAVIDPGRSSSRLTQSGDVKGDAS